MGIANLEKADASPTKRFFVSMLTRDISLEDAILDLVDNSLDGALRLAGGRSENVDYSNHTIDIELNESRFCIADNCGGIPRDIAKNYAFKMGRDFADDRDPDSETIGMYGVGMKRAIFKMGRNAIVKTKHHEDAYQVPISSAWLEEREWNPLPIEPLDHEAIEKPGTVIEVSDLYPGVSRHFDNPAFRNDLMVALSEHFTLFLERGLKIRVNDRPIRPITLKILASESPEGPAPYAFQKTIDDVLVTIAIGLNSPQEIPDDDEEDEETEFASERSTQTAGWTIFCNDRAVIFGDKTKLTGWGDGAPRYHPQFSIITGIVEFKATNVDKLPVTTTKRALDASSNVWLETIGIMRRALKIWTSYTNKWKNFPREKQAPYWKSAKPCSLPEAMEVLESRMTERSGAKEFDPQKAKVLPVPNSDVPSSRRIVFSKPLEDIRFLGEALFDDKETKPGIIGEECFDRILKEMREKEESGE